MDTRSPTLTMLNLDPGSVVGGRYEICERIGSGGMGLVFRVIDRELNNEVVALKLLHPHLAQDENLFKRFRNEVLVARSLTHPNIVRLHDIGRTHDGFSYISMEFVDGFSLKDRISPSRPDSVGGKVQAERLSFEEALPVLYAILTAVAHAHGKGIIHRDLKPANVLISKSGEVKLADFGTARISGMDTSLTQTGQVIGTPDYMSPEQIRGEQLDSSCDIYSLGILAYELVVGERPFVADSSVAVAFKHLHEPIPKFAEGKSGIPLWYQEMVKKASAKDKADRFGSAYEFARVVAEHLPEGVKATQMFTATGSHIISSGTYKTTSSGTSHAAENAPPTQFSTALASDEENDKKSQSAKQGSERGFELGANAGSVSEKWEIGNISDVSSGPFNVLARNAERAGPKRKAGSLVVMFSALVVIGLVSFSIVEREVVTTWIANLSNPQVNTSLIAKNIDVNQSPTATERADLEKELLGEEFGAKVPQVEVSELTISENNVGEVNRPKEEPTEGPKELPKEITPKEVPPQEVTTAQGVLLGNELETKAVESNLVEKIEAQNDEAKKNLAENKKLVDVGGNEEKVTRGGEGVVENKTISTNPPMSSEDLKPIEVKREPESKPEPVLKLEKPKEEKKPAAKVAPKVEEKPAEVKIASTRIDVHPPRREVRAQVENPARVDVPVPGGTTSSGLIDSGQTENVSGLPPAQGYLPPPVVSGTTESYSSLNDGADTLLAPDKPVVDVVRESYSGSISLGLDAKAQSTMLLNLEVGSDNSISGSGRIDELGEFQIDGKVLPRGIELTLRNSETSIRLTGSRKVNDSMRGRFQAPGLNKRGAWDVRYMK